MKRDDVPKNEDKRGIGRKEAIGMVFESWDRLGKCQMW